MTKQLKFFAILAVAVSLDVASSSSTAFGQELVKARGGAGNITSTELRNIYREDVGTGYTSQSLNQLSLQNARAQVGNVGQASMNSGGAAPRLQSSLGGGTASKPFSSVSNSPTVSPYLNLFRDDFDGGGDFNYQTLVRPQFQQLATNQQFQRQNTELSQRVQAISAQSAFKNPAGSEQQYPTGHQTAFGYYGNYYPGMPRRTR
jgi:hypothetical protein